MGRSLPPFVLIGFIPSYRVPAVVAGFFGLSANDLRTRTQVRPYVTARMVTAYILSKYYRLKSAEISSYFDLERTSVNYYANTMESEMGNRRNYLAPLFEAILQGCRSTPNHQQVRYPKLFDYDTLTQVSAMESAPGA
jgi:hypothetical protein